MSARKGYTWGIRKVVITGMCKRKQFYSLIYKFTSDMIISTMKGINYECPFPNTSCF